MVDISFGMTNADYLDSIESKCRHLVGVIKDVCLTHWNGFMKDAEVGRQLASRVREQAAALSERIAAAEARATEASLRADDLNAELARVNAQNAELVRALSVQCEEIAPSSHLDAIKATLEVDR